MRHLIKHIAIIGLSFVGTLTAAASDDTITVRNGCHATAQFRSEKRACFEWLVTTDCPASATVMITYWQTNCDGSACEDQVHLLVVPPSGKYVCGPKDGRPFFRSDNKTK
jgi:hypothetical protein